MKQYVILGGGVSGIAAAWKLAEANIPVIVLEKNNVVGGMAGTFQYKEYLLDYGPHKIYSQLPIFEEVKQFLKKDLLEVQKTSKIRLCGKYLNYPFGMIELLLTLGPVTAGKCGISYGIAMAKGMLAKKDTSYEDYIINRFGKATYNLIFGPYAEKAWGNPRKLDKSLAASRIVIPNLLEMIRRMLLGDQGKKELSASTFFYPAYGAVEMAQRMIESIEKKNGKVIVNATPLKIHIDKNKASTIVYKENEKVKTVEIEGIISTIPMKAFLGLLKNIPEEVNNAVERLKFRKLILLYIEAKKDRLIPENWLFFPEKKYLFNRLSEQKGFSGKMIPNGRTILCIEITVDHNSPEAQMNDAELYDRVIPQLEECGIMKREDTISYFTKQLKEGYPVYHIRYKEDVETFLQLVESYQNLWSIGRQGMFNYVGTIDCIDMGTTTAAAIIGKQTAEQWKEQRKKFENYVTID